MRIAVIVVAIAMVSSPSLASPSCMTMSEARQKLGAVHLYWHGAGHCWDATPGRHRLAQRASTREQVERDAPQEAVKPSQEEKPPRQTQVPRWREAMSEMLPEDAPRMQAPARPRADSAPAETPSPRMNWLDRWVDVVQRVPLIVNESGPADHSAAPGPGVEPMVTVEPIITPTRVMLALLAVLLTLAVIEILFRTTIPEWRE